MFTPEQMEIIEPAIWNTWNYIGYDAGELCEGDNEVAIELCIDAGRLSDAVQGAALERAKAAECLIDQAIKSMGYKKVRKYLSRKIDLV